MRENDLLVTAATETGGDNTPVSVLVVGCGLIGTSLALALQAGPEGEGAEVGEGRLFVVDGVEVNTTYREWLIQHPVFRHVHASLPTDYYDIAVLAVPVDAACEILSQIPSHADIIMDVCSVKSGLCERAAALHLQGRFAPTHPMAGKAVGGPMQADGMLFRGQSWLYIDGFAACDAVKPLMEHTGAKVIKVASAAAHDAAMAAVSHSIHLCSLAAMLAYADAERLHDGSYARLTGPGFRDVTRLSASPADFWVETLLANSSEVVGQLGRLRTKLAEFEDAIASGDAHQLRKLLEAAQSAHFAWQEVRSLPR